MKNPMKRIALLLLLLSGTAYAADDLDPALSEYSKQSGISGNIISVGSDTLAGEQPQHKSRAQLFEWYVGQIDIFTNSPRQRG